MQTQTHFHVTMLIVAATFITVACDTLLPSDVLAAEATTGEIYDAALKCNEPGCPMYVESLTEFDITPLPPDGPLMARQFSIDASAGLSYSEANKSRQPLHWKPKDPRIQLIDVSAPYTNQEISTALSNAGTNGLCHSMLESVSAPGMSKDGNDAMLLHATRSGGWHSQGEMLHLHKKPSGWHVVGRQFLWTS